MVRFVSYFHPPSLRLYLSRPGVQKQLYPRVNNCNILPFGIGNVAGDEREDEISRAGCQREGEISRAGCQREGEISRAGCQREEELSQCPVCKKEYDNYMPL